MNRLRAQLRLAITEFEHATAHLDLPDPVEGWRLTPAGEVRIQLRPFLPSELVRLARALEESAP
ncbi:hypothetical protein ACFW1A_39945 [Kitasatospora sp. NPDC058965]|uniref:hypothetical protein n=1 Tax=Kitasatospora sp. NPDC058965 TaxID=3346682 RepID=UPI0036D1FFCE